MSGGRLLLVFSGPRAGSNLLVDLLGGMPGTLALSEIFNPAGIFGLNLHPEIEDRVTEDAGGAAALQRLFRMAPEEAMALLDAAVPRGVTLIVKVMPHQVHARALNAILRDYACGALFLTRRRIDQYASLLTALETGVWFGADTSGLRPVAHVDKFLGWAGMLDGWLANMQASCDQAGVRWVQLHYESDLACADADQRAERLAARMAALKMPVDAKDLPRRTFFARQDRHREGFDKLSNGPELLADLDVLGMQDFALGQTDLPPI